MLNIQGEKFNAQIGLIGSDFAPKMYGVEVIVMKPPLLSVQARTHRRRRINKKWRKRYGLKTIIDPSVDLNSYLQVGNRCYCYPPGAALLREKINPATHS